MDAIPYTSDGGYYEVRYATVQGGPYALGGTTADKLAGGLTVGRSFSLYDLLLHRADVHPLHGDQQNLLYSALAAWTTATTLPPPGNHPPVVTVNQSVVVVDEGQQATNSGTAVDPDGAPLTLSASVPTVKKLGGGNWSWSYTPADGPANLTVTISAFDGVLTSQVTFTLTVNNVAPTATLIWPRATFLPGEPVTLAFTNPSDPSPADAAAGFVYSFDCQSDGQWEVAGSPTPTYDCIYAASGHYSATGQIADHDGGVSPYSVPVTVLEPVRSHHILNELQVQVAPTAAGAEVTLVAGEQPDG
jgi:hypothetical protein